jgi:hypothetical protein
MSREAYERFVTCAGEFLRCFDCVEYVEGKGEVAFHRFGSDLYDDLVDDEVVALLARFKDRDGLDSADWYGEDPLDRGRYYIRRGRWCRVRVVMPPPPPEESPEWRPAAEAPEGG